MKITISFPEVEKVITDFGLQEGGPAQTFLTSEVKRLSDDYVPMSSGALKNNTTDKPNHTGYVYESIYAQYQWEGNLMVDPITLKGSFFNETYGHWSRPGVPKILDPDGRKLNNFNGIRGPYWVERMWADRKDEIIAAVNKFIKEENK